MTIFEASEKYNIPVKILQEYESWGLCGEVKKVMGAWHYDDSDIERLGTIMTLHDIGFTNAEVERYTAGSNGLTQVRHINHKDIRTVTRGVAGDNLCRHGGPFLGFHIDGHALIICLELFDQLLQHFGTPVIRVYIQKSPHSNVAA